MIKASLVLEGGGVRGLFTAGILDYLMEKNVYLSHVVGVSAGACNAIDYISRQIGRSKDCMVPLSKKDRYYSKPFEIHKKGILDMDKLYYVYPNEIFPFDYNTYFNSEIFCEMVTTNCETGKAEYMDERTDKGKLMNICRASGSMPVISPIVYIDNTPYLDGGLADSLPIKRALTYGNDKTVVILTRQKGYRKSPMSKGAVAIQNHLYKNYKNIVQTSRKRYKNYNSSIELIEQMETKGEIFVLRPQVKTISKLSSNTEKLTNFYNHGYLEAQKEFNKLKEYLEI